MSRERAALNNGFTLVELILVIIVLGIVTTVTTSYLGLGVRMYTEANERAKLLNQSRFAIERLTRELRNVVPNSVRIQGSCIEFMPLSAAARYSIAPFDSAGTSLTFYSALPEWQDADASNDNILVKNGDYVSIYPTLSSHIYSDIVSAGVEKRTVQIAAHPVAAAGTVSLSIASNRFPAQSSSQRMYLMPSSPVSYCLTNGQLRRYDNYAVTATQQVMNSSGGILMAENLEQGSFQPFTIAPAVLQRNSVVHIILKFQSDVGDDLFFNQEVHIPNVP
jgi:MSHA biogenesis protein MshO